MLVVGFSGGVLDAVGGGERGQIVTSTLRQVPRYVVGSVNLTEFSITFATSATFIVTLESANLEPVIPLVFGGSSAPRSPVSNRLRAIVEAFSPERTFDTRTEQGVSGVLGGVNLAKHSQTVSFVCATKKQTDSFGECGSNNTPQHPQHPL